MHTGCKQHQRNCLQICVLASSVDWAKQGGLSSRGRRACGGVGWGGDRICDHNNRRQLGDSKIAHSAFRRVTKTWLIKSEDASLGACARTLQKISMPYEFSPRLVAPPTFSTRVMTPSGTSRINGGSCREIKVG